MSKLKKKKKPMFHKPEVKGEIRKIPTTVPMKIISVVSLLVLAALTAICIYAAIRQSGETLSLSEGFDVNARFVYILLPVVGWLVALGFRLAVRFIPLEMWRLPSGIKEATLETSGKYLKFATLLLELETAAAFCYIALAVYHRTVPGDIPILIWVAAVAATIIFFGRYVQIAAERES